MKKRILWVDSAKGLGILLVMLGHTSITGGIVTEIYTFHVPFFFFISGYLFTYHNNFKVFIKKRITTLLIPYVLFSIVNLIAYYIFGFGKSIVLGKNSLSLLTWYVPIIHNLLGIRDTATVATLWFLTALLFAELLFYLIVKIANNKTVPIVLCIAICAVTGYFICLKQIFIPWSIDLSFTATSFYGIGYLLSKHKKDISCKINNHHIKWMLLPIAVFVNMVSGFANYKVLHKHIDLFYGVLGNPFLFYISAISGIAFFALFIRNIYKIIPQFIQYIGCNSLVFFVIHQKLVYPEISYVLDRISAPFLHGEIQKNIDSILLVLISVGIIAVVNTMLVKYFPFMIGKKAIYATGVDAKKTESP